MTAPKSIYQLVEKFERNKDQYKHQDYNESQVRAEFVDPLFEALGWNMRDSSQVKREGRVSVWGRVKHPDYSFMVGRGTAFYVETKKPSINLRDSAESAVQLRAYGWSGNTEVGILTDFEEFVVYDCRVEPKTGDSANAARVWLMTYEHYIEQWEELVKYFSRDAVQAGEHRAILESKPRGIFGVDAAFLRDMERWRETLAKDIAKRNPNLNQRELNLLVQRTIDRIVFLRIAEDRRIEPYGRLERTAGEGRRVYEELKILFREADDKYNSGLFHFNPDSARASEADNLSMKIKLASAPLRSIIRELYPWQSLYQFSVIPADILGQVYERFLGKVIELSEDGQAQVTDKPEVRKAGGVYYTPTYIVDYIVENTVGKLLKGKTPSQVAKLRILDPACGSGSFLIGAYQYLMDWHLDYYQARLKENPNSNFNSRVRNIGTEADTNFVLAIEEKQRILLDNIYGVDLDQNAVEVTKLSLLLKMLEKEHSQAPEQYALMKIQILPDLGQNIRWGNSLINSDFYRGKDLALIDDEEVYRIKAFDWESEARGFGEIMAQGGFDVVIGNPPYVDSEWMTQYYPEERNYCTTEYRSASGNWDLFCVFIEKALNLCRDNGISGMIVPNKLGSANYAKSIREILANSNSLLSIRDYSHIPVFPVGVYPIVYIVQKYRPYNRHVLYERMHITNKKINVGERHQLDYQRYFSKSNDTWGIFSRIDNSQIVEKVQKNPALAQMADVLGAATVSEAYNIKPLIDEADNHDNFDIRMVNSGTIDRFTFLWGQKSFRYIKLKFEKPIIPVANETKLPRQRFKQAITPKIIIAGMTKRLECALDSDGKILAGKSTTIIISKQYKLKYLIGILNSSLISYYYKAMFGGNKLGGEYLRIGPLQLKTIPIRTIDFDKRRDVGMHDNMVNLVETMLDLHKQLPGLSGIRLDTVKARIESTDRQIDRLVYRLYGLTVDEIVIVEGK